MANNFFVVGQKWEESEAGWGTRQDGWSFHKDMDARNRYVDDYWAKQPDVVQDEYSREDGDPATVRVSEELYKEVMEKGSVRLWLNRLEQYENWKKS